MKLPFALSLLMLAALLPNPAYAACALSNAQLFQQWDFNHDGYMDEGEYTRGESDRLNRLNIKIPNNALHERFLSFGQDAVETDKITVQEFVPLDLPAC